uniref:Uncharacterized protein n=1 Tax=Spironucleus salmonicida TaxID=348837 RepID=V6LVQ7_9EUKA|eukprot:EST48707.1 Hypothetical protein SS50377_11024 [Spironucleus salmonicida]
MSVCPGKQRKTKKDSAAKSSTPQPTTSDDTIMYFTTQWSFSRRFSASLKVRWVSSEARVRLEIMSPQNISKYRGLIPQHRKTVPKTMTAMGRDARTDRRHLSSCRANSFIYFGVTQPHYYSLYAQMAAVINSLLHSARHRSGPAAAEASVGWDYQYTIPHSICYPARPGLWRRQMQRHRVLLRPQPSRTQNARAAVWRPAEHFRNLALATLDTPLRPS